MNTALVVWVLVALCGIVLAVAATDVVLHVLGLVLGVVGVVAAIMAATRLHR